MCPFCIGSAVLMAGGVISTGGLAALVRKLRAKKKDAQNSVQNPNPKEETWEK
jgi:hypothetical protein